MITYSYFIMLRRTILIIKINRKRRKKKHLKSWKKKITRNDNDTVENIPGYDYMDYWRYESIAVFSGSLKVKPN